VTTCRNALVQAPQKAYLLPASPPHRVAFSCGHATPAALPPPPAHYHSQDTLARGSRATSRTRTAPHACSIAMRDRAYSTCWRHVLAPRRLHLNFTARSTNTHAHTHATHAAPSPRWTSRIGAPPDQGGTAIQPLPYGTAHAGYTGDALRSPFILCMSFTTIVWRRPFLCVSSFFFRTFCAMQLDTCLPHLPSFPRVCLPSHPCHTCILQTAISACHSLDSQPLPYPCEEEDTGKDSFVASCPPPLLLTSLMTLL